MDAGDAAWTELSVVSQCVIKMILVEYDGKITKQQYRVLAFLNKNYFFNFNFLVKVQKVPMQY